jgi:hypothetical protein
LRLSLSVSFHHWVVYVEVKDHDGRAVETGIVANRPQGRGAAPCRTGHTLTFHAGTLPNPTLSGREAGKVFK